MVMVEKSQENETNEKREQITKYSEQKEVLVTDKALQILKQQKNWQNIIDNLLAEKHFVISDDLVKSKISNTKIDLNNTKIKISNTVFKPYASEIEPNFKIRKDLEVTGKSTSEGKIDDFYNYFQNKFKLLSEMLQKRQHLKPKPIKRIKGFGEGEEVELIAMVTKKWISKKGHLTFELEDLEAKCIIVISKNEKKLMEEAKKIVLDDVIGLKGKKISSDLIIATEVFLPDLPTDRTKKLIDKNSRIASISDMHVGSKIFLEQDFNKFLNWINCKIGTEKEKEEIGRIKYLIIPGDNVDGIGVFPNQQNELEIKDIYQQYDKLSELLLQIPEYIEVFLAPGNHDAVRVADPQPALPKKYIPKLYNAKNIHMIGSPGWIEIEGLKILVFHGATAHDLYTLMSGLDRNKPQNAVKELLRRRDLMPSFGLKHPYVPEKYDYMVIKEKPDYMFLGEMHRNGYGYYRGTTIICNGTWQGQTEYQIKLGHKPTPGRVVIINIKTGQIQENVFHRED